MYDVVISSIGVVSGETFEGWSVYVLLSRSGACVSGRICNIALAAIVCCCGSAAGQGADSLMTLPDSPGWSSQSQTTQAPSAAGTASVSGKVFDHQGKEVVGAQVTLIREGGGEGQVVTSGTDGEFLFPNLPAEKVTITITAKGLETFLSNEIKLAAGEKYRFPSIDLPMMLSDTSVQVTVTEDQLATEQVKEQEKQRVFGVIPNFYTSFLWNAAPMRTKQKFRLVLRSSTDPVVFLVVGIRAGVEQVRGTDPGYGDGLSGFAQRFGAAYGDSVTGRLIGGAILPSLLHQDPRYFYKGSGSIPARTWYAISRAVICRGDNGKWQPNYSHVLGNFASAGLRNLYLAPEDRKGAKVVLNGFSTLGYNALSNLIREFALRKATSHVPDYANGDAEIKSTN